MTAVDDFLTATLAQHLAAERAMHEGDVMPRVSTWSHTDPVTLFGAAITWRSGWDDVRPVFEWVASRFIQCTDYDFELLAAGASGDLAYTVGIERYAATTTEGSSVHNELRVTHVFRRENGDWKVVHRHGDHLPDPG
ncbi:MAG: nuclear transport factor 2 family protein [Actinomycetota bacterium]|nr:nuclear transport factor 2 family protein [Actinomycetota bacterium]